VVNPNNSSPGNKDRKRHSARSSCSTARYDRQQIFLDRLFRSPFCPQIRLKFKNRPYHHDFKRGRSGDDKAETLAGGHSELDDTDSVGWRLEQSISKEPVQPLRPNQLRNEGGNSYVRPQINHRRAVKGVQAAIRSPRTPPQLREDEEASSRSGEETGSQPTKYRQD